MQKKLPTHKCPKCKVTYVVDGEGVKKASCGNCLAELEPIDWKVTK